MTTNNITISVISKYEGAHSDPGQGKFVHSYLIKIENQGSSAVQLLSREWLIKDTHLIVRQVKGDGVVGKQPVIRPGGSHQYTSWCPVSSEIGQMSGKYRMKRLADDQIFYVKIPAFTLAHPCKLN